MRVLYLPTSQDTKGFRTQFYRRNYDAQCQHNITLLNCSFWKYPKHILKGLQRGHPLHTYYLMHLTSILLWTKEPSIKIIFQHNTCQTYLEHQYLLQILRSPSISVSAMGVQDAFPRHTVLSSNGGFRNYGARDQNHLRGPCLKIFCYSSSSFSLRLLCL